MYMYMYIHILWDVIIRRPLLSYGMCASSFSHSLSFSFSLFPDRDVLRSPRFFSLARFRCALPSLLHWATLLYFIVMQRGHFYYDRANISRFQLAANAFIAEGVFASSPFPPTPSRTYDILYLLQSGHTAEQNSVHRIELKKIKVSNTLNSKYISNNSLSLNQSKQ